MSTVLNKLSFPPVKQSANITIYPKFINIMAYFFWFSILFQQSIYLFKCQNKFYSSLCLARQYPYHDIYFSYFFKAIYVTYFSTRPSFGKGNGNPLQYSCMGNPMHRRTWGATVHGVARIGHDLASKPPPSPRTSLMKLPKTLLIIVIGINIILESIDVFNYLILPFKTMTCLSNCLNILLCLSIGTNFFL